MSSKYFYNGIPLADYCRDNDLNVNIIRSRIIRNLKSEKYIGFSEQEIISITIENFEPGIRYYYEGMTLRAYCKENNINIGIIERRINKIRRNNSSLSDDEVVAIAMEDVSSKKYKYLYHDSPLSDLSLQYPELNINSLRAFIKNKLAKNPNLKTDDIVDEYIAKGNKGNKKYFYQGIPLKEYCKQKGLNYENIIFYISRFKIANQNRNLTDDEIVEEYLTGYKPSRKYFYKGVPVHEYCKTNGISFGTIEDRIYKIKTDYPILNNDDVVRMAFEDERYQRKSTIIYQGMLLKEYCIINNINYISFMDALYRFRHSPKSEGLSDDEIVEKFITTYKPQEIKYKYGDLSLEDYCILNNIPYNTIINHIYRIKEKFPELSDDDLVELAIKDKKYQRRCIYYYNGKSLRDYCKGNELIYNTIQGRIYSIRKMYPDIPIDEVVRLAIEDERFQFKIKYYYKGVPLRTYFKEDKDIEYENVRSYIIRKRISGSEKSDDEIVDDYIEYIRIKNEIKRINEIFTRISEKKDFFEDEKKEITESLKIKLDNVKSLENLGFSFKQSINLIWYFYDEEDENQNKIISIGRVSEVFDFVDLLKKQYINIEEIELVYLFGLYKSDIYDSREEILKREKLTIRKIIDLNSRANGISLSVSDYGEFENDLMCFLIELLEKINSNISPMLQSYFNKSLTGELKGKLAKYKRELGMLFLDKEAYDDETGEDIKERIIIPSINSSHSDEKPQFGPEMVSILSQLEDEDRNLLVLKFQERLSDEELASILNMELDEVKEKQENLLSSLRGNDKVKSLKYKNKKERKY